MAPTKIRELSQDDEEARSSSENGGEGDGGGVRSWEEDGMLDANGVGGYWVRASVGATGGGGGRWAGRTVEVGGA
jgi:hypothetical protein